MKAITLEKFGGPEVLQIRDVPRPKPKSDEVLIKVAACGINRPDIVQRNGLYPPPPGASDILGLECAGTIVEIGQKVTKWNIGDPVCALLTGGGYAEFATANENTCLRIPKNIDLINTAGIPETFFTVWSNLFDRAHLKRGDLLLVHGGTSGIGTTTIQFAKAFGANVITTSSSTQKCDYCLSLGADFAINYKTDDFVQEIKQITNSKGVDIILDMVAGDYMEKNIKSLKKDGTLVIIAVQHGPKVNFNILPVMLKRLTITGSTLRPRSTEYKSRIAQALEEQIWPLVEKGDIKPVINKTFKFDEVQAAHKYLESGDHIGKVILVNG